ncbi:MAG: carboxypeptidase-like regulatory domain-containing protein, partial [Terriglobales bacterium]
MACLSAAQPSWSQYTAGRIEGTVKDSTGAVLNGARVTLASRGTNASRTFITGRDGYYAFFALPPGSYVLLAEAPTFTGPSVDLIVSTNQTLRQDLVLGVGQTATRVEVTS